MDADVVVIGAGLSGLACARMLHQEGVDVVVLEARERVGGRVLTVRHEGIDIDLGGGWTGPGQEPLRSLAAEVGVTTTASVTAGKAVELERGRRRVGVRPLAWAMVLQACAHLDRLAAPIDTEQPWAARTAAALDGQTIQTWLRTGVRGSGARWRLRSLLRSVYGAEPDELSLLHLLFYSRADGGVRYLIGIEGGSQQERFTTGAQSIAIRVADELGSRVRLGHPVRRIDHGTDEVVASGLGFSVRAKHAVVAMPPTLAGRIHWSPPLPPARDQLHQRVPIAGGFKIVLVYDRPFWREEGLSGSAVADDGIIRVILDAGAANDGPGVLVGFIDGAEAVKASALSAAERRRVVLARMVEFLGVRAGDPAAYLEWDWSAEEFSRGCVSLFPPGVWTTVGGALRTPVGRVYWAGTETATAMAGQMDGAVRAGRRAAREVLDALAGDKAERSPSVG